MEIPEDLESRPKHEIKQVKLRLIKTLDYIEAERAKLRQELTGIYGSLTRVNKALGRKVFKGSPVKEPTPKENSQQEIVVTDHALLRYIERFNLLDVEALREEIKAGIPNEVIKGRYEVVELDEIGYRLAFDRDKVTVLTAIKIK